jgi:hypothetical protein
MYIFYFIIFICCIELIYITSSLVKYILKNKKDIKKEMNDIFMMLISIPILRTWYLYQYFITHNHKTNILLYIFIPFITFLLLSFIYINIDNFILVFTLDNEMRKNLFANIFTMIFEITAIYFLLKKLNENSSISSSKELFYFLYNDLKSINSFFSELGYCKDMNQLILKKEIKKFLELKRNYSNFLCIYTIYSVDKGHKFTKDIFNYLLKREELLNMTYILIFQNSDLYNVKEYDIEKISDIIFSPTQSLCIIDDKYKLGVIGIIDTLTDDLLYNDFIDIASHLKQISSKLNRKRNHKIKNPININFEEHAKMI